MRSRALAVFDLDSTLVDSKVSIKQCIGSTITAWALRVGADMPLNSLLAKPRREVFRSYLVDGTSNSLIEESVDYSRTIYPALADQTIRTFPGIKDALHVIHSDGIMRACGTSKGSQAALNLLRHFELLGYFNRVLGEDRVKKAKPDPKVAWTLMSETGIAPEHTIVIGDSVSDIECGKNAGTATCGVTYGFFTEDQLKNAMPDYIAHTPAAIAEIVSRFARGV